jgi:ribosomal-protein-alanine N-acetyltransferase
MNLDLFDTFPILHTPALCLRELRDEDSPAMFELFRDPEATRYHSLETMTELANARQVVAELRERYRLRTGIRWAITHATSTEVLGSIGLKDIDTHEQRATTGYDLRRSVWGRGHATEALRAVVEFGHQHVGLERIDALVMLDNVSSVRVLTKAGFVEEGVLRSYGYWKGRHHDLRMFSSLRSRSRA